MKSGSKMNFRKELMMKANSNIWIVLILGSVLIFSLVGCDSEPTEVEDYQQEPVIYAYLSTGESFDVVHLEWVAKNIEAFYDPMDYVIEDANVRIFTTKDVTTGDSLLPGDPDYQEVQYAFNPTLGYYEPSTIDGLDEVRTLTRYRIEAIKGDEVNLWAETTTPDTFTAMVTTNSPDPRYAQLTQQLITGFQPPNPEELPNGLPLFNRAMDFIHLEWSNAWPGGASTPSGNVLNIVTLVDTTDLQRLDPDWDPTDPDDEIEPEEMWRANYTIAPSYQNALDIVWIFFGWVGPHRLDILASSYEYYRYRFTLINGVPFPESYVHGGLGCFGAYTQKSMYLNMVKYGVKIYIPSEPVNYASHDFGNVPVMTSVDWNSKIFNMGSDPLIIESLTMEETAGYNFEIITQGLSPWTLESGDYLDYTLRCTPQNAAEISSALLIESNDPFEGSKQVPVLVVGIP